MLNESKSILIQESSSRRVLPSASLIVAIAYFVINFCPVVLQLAPRFITISNYLLPVLWFGLEMSNGFKHWGTMHKAYRQEIWFLACWILVITLNWFLDRGFSGSAHFSNVWPLLIVFAMSALTVSKSIDSFKLTGAILILFLSFGDLLGVRAMIQNPLLARLYTEHGSLVAWNSEFLGVSNYSGYAGKAIILPVLFSISFLYRGMSRLALLIGCGVIGISIAYSTFTGAFLLMCFGIALMVLLQISLLREKKTVFLFIIVLLVFSFVIIQLSDNPAIKYATDKIERLFYNVSDYGMIKGDETGRASLLLVSWETFLEDPFFGIGSCTGSENPWIYVRVGAHSSIIDGFAEYGVFGFGFFLLFFGALMKRISQNAFARRKDMLSQALFAMCTSFFLGSIINPTVHVFQIMGLFLLFAMTSHVTTYKRQ